jgi:hypothetical protein
MDLRVFGRSTILLLCLITVLAGTIGVRAATVETIVIIDEIDASGFPDIVVRLRILDDDNNVARALASGDVAVYENGQVVKQIEIGPAERGPISVIYVLDSGQSANFRALMAEKVRSSMLQLGDGYFRDGIDTVAILQRREIGGRDETIVALEPTQSLATFTNAINALDLSPTGRTEGLSAVGDALSLLSQRMEAGHEGAAIIFISRVIEWPQQSVAVRRAQDIAAAAREQLVPVYSLHTDSNFGDPLEALSTRSGGEYLQLSVDRDVGGGLKQIYDSIAAQGVTYVLSYRSKLGESGSRSVAIGPAGTTAESASATGSYDVSLKPAAIQFLAPDENALFTRTASRVGEDLWDYDLDAIPVSAELVTWPDGYSRAIERVEFLAQDVVRHAVDLPPGNLFSFNLDISDVEIPQAIVLHARLIDELGLSAETESLTINIGIDKPEEVTVVVLPTQTPPPPPTPVVINQDPCAGGDASPECLQNRTLSYAPWGIVVVLLIALLVYRRRLLAVAGAAGGALRERAADVRHTVLGGSGRRGGSVLAVLRVEIARPDLQGKEIKIYTKRTTIGRNPKLSDVQLYDEDEVSSVSGQHCTIQFDRGRFVITDDNSANGTEVNGRKLSPNSPHMLNHGDEIVLGDLFRRGAKLRFAMAKPAVAHGSAAQASATIIDDDFKPASVQRSSETEVEIGSETVVGFSEDAEDTMFSDRPVIPDRRDDNDDDWLNDLE